MTHLFGLKKTLTAIPAAGAMVILGAFTALAWGSGAPVDNLQQCQDSTGATCSNVQETSAVAVHRQAGPTVTDSQTAVILTLGDLAPGNYKVMAKTDIVVTPGSTQATCSLVVSPPGGAQGTVDRWFEADSFPDTTAYVANLQRTVTLNPSLSTSYTIQLVCTGSSTSPTGSWSASNSSIIAKQVQNLNEQEVNS
jgi:hypothetical protein